MMLDAILFPRVCLPFIAIVAVGALPHSVARAYDTKNEKALISAIQESQLKREQLYENGHFVWLETNTVGANVTEVHYEYWANSGKHFRLDSYALKDGEPVGDIRRLISTPSDVTLIIAQSVLDPGTIAASTSSGICKNGRCPPSPESISGQYFVAHASRYATVRVKDVIQWWEEKSWDLTDLKFVQNDANACVLTFTREKSEGTLKHSVTMDPTFHRVQSWTYEFFGKDDMRHAVQNSVFVYGGINPEIPTEEHSVASSNFNLINRSSTKLIEFTLEPAEPKLFLLPSNGG